MADASYNVKCGFFDSVNSDRKYSADDLNNVFQRIVGNGVFANPDGTASNDLNTVWDSGLKVKVKKGQGIFGNRWFNNPSDISITVPSNTTSNGRIDSVIAQVDTRESGRNGKIVYRTGTPSTSPVHPPINQITGVAEYRLADVTVAAAAQVPSISDLRGIDTPWVTGLIASSSAEGYTKAETDSLLDGKVDKLATGTANDKILFSNSLGISSSGIGIQQTLQNTNDYIPTSGAVFADLANVIAELANKFNIQNIDINDFSVNNNRVPSSPLVKFNKLNAIESPTQGAIITQGLLGHETVNSGKVFVTSGIGNESTDAQIPTAKLVKDNMAQVFKGTTTPPPSTSLFASAKAGDIYIDTSTNTLYQCTGIVGTSIIWRRAAYKDAVANVLTRTHAPTTSTEGKVGDLYIAVADSEIYYLESKQNNDYVWIRLADENDLDDCSKVHQSTSNPTTSDAGNVGDLWVNTSTGKVFVYLGLSGLSNLWSEITTSKSNPSIFSGNGEPTDVDGAKVGDIYINTNVAASKKAPYVLTAIIGTTQYWNAIVTDLQVQTTGTGTSDSMVMSAKLVQAKLDALSARISALE